MQDLTPALRVRLAVGAVLLVIGVVLLGIGVMAMTSDTYDTTRAGHVIIGLMWAVPGLALAAGGLVLILGRNSR
jgi:ABC-type Fe3+ transport system permease subunit